MKLLFCLIAFIAGLIVTVNVNNPEAKDSQALVTSTVSVTQPVREEKRRELAMNVSPFGVTQDGEEVRQFELTNQNGISLKLIDYGATLVSLSTPNNRGEFENIVLGCEDMAGYEACTSFFGSTVGRYANRIENATFDLDGRAYSLEANDGPNQLHGGKLGFDKRIWKGTPIESDDFVGVCFELISPDGDQGFPGELSVTVEYRLNNQNELSIVYRATTDSTTHVNLTNHTYWNLAGANSGNILEDELKLESDSYLPTNESLIPTGESLSVSRTPFDFTSYQRIGERIKETGGSPIGYDHCFILSETKQSLQLAATVVDYHSGRELKVFTTQPAVQFYSGNFLDGLPGSGGFGQYAAFCLETQHYPNSPNERSFPSTVLKPGQRYQQTTVFQFGTVKSGE